MRTADTMDVARAGMGVTFERISGYLPAGPLKEEFDRRSNAILEKARAATEQQARLERTPGEIEGERFVKPEPASELSSRITHQHIGGEIHYSRHDAKTGAYQTLAFIDKGQQLDVRDWNNTESVNAALQVASQKWETLTINGSDAYKETVAQLAAEYGYKIINPELQDRIRGIRAENEARQIALAQDRAATEATKRQTDTQAPGSQWDAESEKAGVATGPILNTTPGERRIELESVRERVDREAERETRQAARAERAHETNAATGSEATPYRSEAEARTAREAERAVDSNPSRPIPSDPSQSEALLALRHEQQRVLSQEELERQRQLEAVERFRQEEQQRQQSKDEDEAETR